MFIAQPSILVYKRNAFYQLQNDGAKLIKVMFFCRQYRCSVLYCRVYPMRIRYDQVVNNNDMAYACCPRAESDTNFTNKTNDLPTKVYKLNLHTHPYFPRVLHDNIVTVKGFFFFQGFNYGHRCHPPSGTSYFRRPRRFNRSVDAKRHRFSRSTTKKNYHVNRFTDDMAKSVARENRNKKKKRIKTIIYCRSLVGYDFSTSDLKISPRCMQRVQVAWLDISADVRRPIFPGFQVVQVKVYDIMKRLMIVAGGRENRRFRRTSDG